ncbi:cyclic nucleotide-gated ion channel 1-like [Malus sylvestris]|uniref:cyclic nucleotide-gated ion channel 1-like n=1 Tax=Malus sylvestris TaxID=3752 RepID=UPI0021AC584D|nr:cyclic nucleotide-gated ion channel 1-like [Malus sylvestris]
MSTNVKNTSDEENPAVEKTRSSINLLQEICDVRQGPYLATWNTVFVVSCVFAVSLDPLFLYVMIIDQDKKCLYMDKKLRIIALLMRSLTDVIFLVHFICEICACFQKGKNKKSGTCVANTLKNGPSAWEEETNENSSTKSWLSIIFDVLALVPLPQLLILVYPMQRSGFVEHQKLVNVFLLCQYVPRFSRIHLSAKVFKMTNGIWAKSLFNLFLYIIASHILGAFWYLFSIQREVSCWYEACVNHSIDPRGCVNAFYCDSQSTTARNITFLNEHCPLDTLDGALPPFNFGIFLDSLKNRNTEHSKFVKKFWYSFWWGLRNLSNFGTNLATSTYVWENMFAVLVSVIGLLLFTYLIGNVQTFMQMEATKTEEMRQRALIIEEALRDKGKRKKIAKGDDGIRQKIGSKKLDVCKWIQDNNFPDDIKQEIMTSLVQALKNDKDADVHNPFLILPYFTKRSVKRFLFMGTLRKVNKLKDMNQKVLTLICDYLKPVTYSENTFVFRMGDPLDCMLFIIKGTMWTYASSSDSHAGQGISSMSIKSLGKGNFYGEELLDWASNCFTEVPVSSKHVKTRTKVEAFVLMSQDLETVVSSQPYWECNNPEEVALATIRHFRTKAQRRLPRPE